MSLNIQTATGLLEIGGKVTKEKVISALGYEPADKKHIEDTTLHVTSAEKENWNNKSDVKHYDDLEGAPNITENDSGNMVIADESGNIIMLVDADGLETTNVSAKTIELNGEDLGVRLDELESISLPNILDNESDELSIADEVGNVIVKIDKDGLETTTVTAQDVVVGGKNIIETIDTHASNIKLHVTAEEKKAWDNKSDFSGFYADLPDAPNITENGSGEVVYADEAGNVIARINANGFETTQVIADTVVVNGVNVEENFAQVNERIDNISVPSIEGLATETYVDEAVANLVNSAPEALNTLDELAAALGDDANFATTVTNQIASKANQTSLDSHTSNATVHVTADERIAWNNKSNFSGDYNDLTNAPSITEDDNGSVTYSDESGNIIAKIDANGFETTVVTAKSVFVNGTDIETALDRKADSEHTHEQYLEAADIANKADKTYVDEELTKKSDSAHTHDEYLVADDIANKADKSELHSHDNKTELDKVVEGKVAYWDAKSEFSGDYNDLENAPNIYEDGSQSVIFADENGNIVMRVDGNGFETTSVTAQTVVVNGLDVGTTLDGKADSVHDHDDIYYRKTAIDTTINLINDAISSKADKEHEHSQYLEADDIEGKANITYVDQAIAEAKTDSSNKDTVVLAEAQKGISAVSTAINAHTDKTDIHITSDERESWNGKADKTYVNEQLDTKVDSAEISHTTETIAEGVSVVNGKLSIVVDAYTKSETLDKIQEKITEINGGESAGEVLSALNSYKEVNDARVGALDTKIDTKTSEALDEAKTDASNKDIVILAEAQRSIEAVQTEVDTLRTLIESNDGGTSIIAITLPADRMLGDANGDGAINSSDTEEILYYATGSEDATDIDRWASNVDSNPELTTDDAIYMNYHLSFGNEDYPIAKSTYYNRWIYSEERGAYYYDVSIEEMTAGHSAVIMFNNIFMDASFMSGECRSGAIRIYSTNCPVEDVICTVVYGSGDGNVQFINGKPSPNSIGAAKSEHTHSIYDISDIDVGETEINYLDGVTSNIQEQLDNKVNKSEVDSLELITVEDIDRICGMTISA